MRKSYVPESASSGAGDVVVCWNAGREGLRSTRVARGPLDGCVFCVGSKCCKVTEEV